ncbi:hypothetical protein GKQ38_02985 [Candidatus Nanohaloarchaea archaeon]|nr:hypothetical protein GKQ38_02985 [Candidatus Nanohaloarchaea archaeon]
MKAQFSIEYFGSMVLFLIAVLGIASIGAGKVPEFRNDVHQASLNLEAYSLSTRLMTQPGYSGHGQGTTNWEKNLSTLRSTEDVGLASDYKLLQKDKIDRLSTVGSDKLNYSIFTEALHLSHDYRFRFTWMPVITTSKSFTRSNSPSFIDEPDSDIDNYWSADNEVHYTVEDFVSTRYCFLTVSHNGVYDTVYKTEYNASAYYPCDFGTQYKYTRHAVGGTLTLAGYPFQLHTVQNRKEEPGAMFVLKRTMTTFGAAFDQDSRVIKLNRYAAMEVGSTVHPVKMEVWAW